MVVFFYKAANARGIYYVSNVRYAKLLVTFLLSVIINFADTFLLNWLK